jgi:hypothetical protein
LRRCPNHNPVTTFRLLQRTLGRCRRLVLLLRNFLGVPSCGTMNGRVLELVFEDAHGGPHAGKGPADAIGATHQRFTHDNGTVAFAEHWCSKSRCIVLSPQTLTLETIGRNHGVPAARLGFGNHYWWLHDDVFFTFTERQPGFDDAASSLNGTGGRNLHCRFVCGCLYLERVWVARRCPLEREVNDRVCFVSKFGSVRPRGSIRIGRIVYGPSNSLFKFGGERFMAGTDSVPFPSLSVARSSRNSLRQLFKDFAWKRE